MLTITIPSVELFDEETQTFSYTDKVIVHLEHSLASLSKWESIHEKPFLSNEPKTNEEVFSYIECMAISSTFTSEQLKLLSSENVEQINAYINAKRTATWFGEDPDKTANKEVVTSELIYYWMVSLNIPFECENWHLNRLLTLIRVVNQKNAPAKKMSRREIAERNRALNERRRKEWGTSG